MINVIGLGYIGLPTALMLSSHKIEVVGTDYKEALVKTLESGRTTFKENGLDELFNEAVKSGIRFTTEYQKTDMYIISVPTPYDKCSKKVDIKYVVAAVQCVIKIALKNAIIVIESIIAPGTIDKVIRPILKKKNREDLQLVHAPERIIPGNIVHELIYNNRTIGADDKTVGEKVKKIYASFCQGEIVITDIRTAEMTKIVENTYRAVNIVFANELAKICSHNNLDIHEIIRICNMHPRVNILQPEPGEGGHCISVDPWFLVRDYPSLAKVIGESMKTNVAMPDFVLNRIYEIMKEQNIKDVSRVGLYGLTYKENVDDMRNIFSDMGIGGIAQKNIILISYADYEYDGRLRSFFNVLGDCGNLYCFTGGRKPVNKHSMVFTGRRYPKFVQAAFKYAQRMIRSHEIDAIFLDNRKSTIPGLILKSKYPGIKFILDCRELYRIKDAKGLPGKVGCFFERFMMKKADAVVCANKERARYMVERYGIAKPIVYENIRALQYKSIYCKKIGQEKFARYFLDKEVRVVATSGCSVDRLNDVLVKNIDQVNGKCRLFLVGDSRPTERKIIQDIITEKKLDNVVILDRLNQDELKYLISNCHIGVVNYHQRDINNRYCSSGKLYEFLYEGLPVVATTNPPLKKICMQYGVGVCDDTFFEGLNHILADYEGYQNRVRKYVAMHPIRKTQEKLKKDLCNRLL